jgi:hypothetical protein
MAFATISAVMDFSNRALSMKPRTRARRPEAGSVSLVVTVLSPWIPR